MAEARNSLSQWDAMPRVQAMLNYAPDVGGEGVGQMTGEQGFGSARAEPMPIYNARPLQSSLSLAREGFVLSEIEVPADGYADDDALERIWTPAVKEKLKAATGASHVVTWGRLVRYSPRSPQSQRTPVSAAFPNVHSDFGAGQFGPHIDHPDAQAALREEMGTDEPKRWLCFNIWMPLSPPPHDVPLALCDARSVAPEDVVLSHLEFKGFDGARPFSVELPRYKYNPVHRWAFFPDLKVGEILLFLGLEGGASPRMVPHSAFTNPECPPGSVPRNSVETRAIAVFD